MTFVHNNEILLTVKKQKKGDDGHKIVSVRMKDELLEKLDELSEKTNRSRNELINTLLEKAIQITTIQS